MLDQLYHLKSLHQKQGILFCFSGVLSQTLLTEVGSNLKDKMKQKEEDSSTILKVFSIFIEQAQNILHYSAEKELPTSEKTSCGHGIMVVGYEQKRYYVSCGNLIENNAVEQLEQQLHALQTMDKEQLKAFYKEQRRKDPPSDSKGAGLGFIELARKASQPIEFNFQPVDDKFSFFALKVTI